MLQSGEQEEMETASSVVLCSLTLYVLTMSYTMSCCLVSLANVLCL